MIELFKESININYKANTVEIDFKGLTSGDREQIFKEVFKDHNEALKLIDLYRINKNEILKFVKENFDIEDLIGVDVEFECECEPELYWKS
jgi:hypothetical protein